VCNAGTWMHFRPFAMPVKDAGGADVSAKNSANSVRTYDRIC